MNLNCLNKAICQVIIIITILFHISRSNLLNSISHNLVRRSQVEDDLSRDYYEFAIKVADATQKARNECKEKFKLNRWTCPLKPFKDILQQISLPANKEMGLVRALLSASITLHTTKACSAGTDADCQCSSSSPSSGIASRSIARSSTSPTSGISNSISSDTINTPTNDNSDKIDTISNNISQPINYKSPSLISKANEFAWKGCEESIAFGFKVSKTYLDSQDNSDSASQMINFHNYEVGRAVIKRLTKKKCTKCNSLPCKPVFCWMRLPTIEAVTSHLISSYKKSAKVGAMKASETNVATLEKELQTLEQKSLVFVDPSPDYCYENASLGIDGTLGRECIRPDSNSTSTREEKESCQRLCTKCGYKVKKVLIKVKETCSCKFEFCCKIKCEECMVSKYTYKCVRHTA